MLNNIYCTFSFRFEKDLLDRAEEAARSSKDVLVGLSSSVSLSRENRLSRRSNSHSDDEEWQSDHVFDSIASDSPRKGKCSYAMRKSIENNAIFRRSRKIHFKSLFSTVIHHLSESDDILPSPLSPPLPEGAVVASEKRMVIVKPPTRSIDGSHSRLNSVEIESVPRHKVCSYDFIIATNYLRVIVSIICQFDFCNIYSFHLPRQPHHPMRLEVN